MCSTFLWRVIAASTCDNSCRSSRRLASLPWPLLNLERSRQIWATDVEGMAETYRPPATGFNPRSGLRSGVGMIDLLSENHPA
jgi:hypothetical protein